MADDTLELPTLKEVQEEIARLEERLKKLRALRRFLETP